MSATDTGGLPPEKVQELVEIIKDILYYNTSSSKGKPWELNEEILGQIINIVAKQINGGRR